MRKVRALSKNQFKSLRFSQSIQPPPRSHQLPLQIHQHIIHHHRQTPPHLKPKILPRKRSITIIRPRVRNLLKLVRRIKMVNEGQKDLIVITNYSVKDALPAILF
jgi:hypothetical protein